MTARKPWEPAPPEEHKAEPDADTQPAADDSDDFDGRVVFGERSTHDVFMAQLQALLANSDIDEEKRQEILTGMSCPCCGGSAASLNVRLKK